MPWFLVKISANAVGVHKHFHDIKIFNKNNTLINNLSGAYELKKNKISKIKYNYPDKKNRKKLIQNFIDTLQNSKIKPIISSKEQINLMSACLAADQSIKENRKIKIKYL